jgi:hypothetical protein
MSQDINFKELERKAWTSYFQDGLWDIFMGLLMLTMGIRDLTDNVWFTFVILAAVLVPIAGKKFITIPRIGRVKFSPARKAKQNKLRAVVGIAVIATGILLLTTLLGLDIPQAVVAPILVICIALVFGLMAYYMDFKRLYAYGLLFAISMALWETLDTPTGPIAFSVSGGIALLIGLAALIRFLRRYPKTAEEVYSDDAD